MYTHRWTSKWFNRKLNISVITVFDDWAYIFIAAISARCKLKIFAYISFMRVPEATRILLARNYLNKKNIVFTLRPTYGKMCIYVTMRFSFWEYIPSNEPRKFVWNTLVLMVSIPRKILYITLHNNSIPFISNYFDKDLLWVLVLYIELVYRKQLIIKSI